MSGNWYRTLVAQVNTLPPEEDVPQVSHEDPLAFVDQVIRDTLEGRNIERIAKAAAGLIKYASAGAMQKVASTGHFRHKHFFQCFRELPNEIKDLARKNFSLMIQNPKLVSLKPINAQKSYGIYSAQVGNSYRAIAVKVGNIYVWYYIGSHESYNRKKDMPPPAASTFPKLPPNIQQIVQKNKDALLPTAPK